MLILMADHRDAENTKKIRAHQQNNKRLDYLVIIIILIYHGRQYVPKKVGLPLEMSLVFSCFLPLLQFSFNHFNKHFLCFDFGNLKQKTSAYNCYRAQLKMMNSYIEETKR